MSAGKKIKEGIKRVLPVGMKVYYLETDADKLYKMIEKQGKVDVKEASAALKVPQERIEEWGGILEEHKMSKMHYPPVGTPVLISNRLAKDKRKKAGEKKHEKPEEVAKPVQTKGYGRGRRKLLALIPIVVIVIILAILIFTGVLQ